MFDGIPFRRSGWVVGDGNGQPKFVGEILEPGLPREAAVPWTRHNQLQSTAGCGRGRPLRPTLTHHEQDCPDRKLWGVMRNPNNHIACIASHMVDAEIGNRFADSVTGKVIDQDRMRRAAPLAARVFEQSIPSSWYPR